MPDCGMLGGLLAVFIISFLGSGPFPLPLTPVMLWLGQFHQPVWVVGAATLGTLAGWLCLEGVLRRWVLRNAQATAKIPLVYQQFFLRRTGLWLFVFNALPFPLDCMRFLALLNNYSRSRLLVILTLSRLVRNTMLVMIGAALAPHQPVLWGAMVAFMVVPLLVGKLMPLLNDWRKCSGRAKGTKPLSPLRSEESTVPERASVDGTAETMTSLSE